MTFIAALLLQAASATDELPRARQADLEAREPKDRHAKGQRDFMGVEVFALWTRWDDGIFIEDDWGVGADLEFGWDYGKFRQTISVGYAGWNTDLDDLPFA